MEKVEVGYRIDEYVYTAYGDVHLEPCPFTAEETAELDHTGELLVYVPPKMSCSELAKHAALRANIDFDNEQMIRCVMQDEGQWFICSASKSPELLYHSAVFAKRAFEDDGLHGMDLRRYLAFCIMYRLRYGCFPDQSYWTFLLSGSYDRSGISIIGFDRHGVLSHHGWMRNFKAKFVGARYVALPPRLEVTKETSALIRARRGNSNKA